MSMPKSGRWTDRARETRRAYAAEHYTTLGAKFPRAEADALRAALAADGLTVNAWIVQQARAYLQQHGAAVPGPDPETAQADDDAPAVN